MRRLHGADSRLPLGGLCLALLTTPVSAVTVTFDDLTLGPDSGENGSGLTPYATGTAFGEVENQNRFASAGVEFENRYIPAFASWSRWAYSNRNDTTTPGFTNDLSAWPATGSNGNFAVNSGELNSIALGAGMHVPLSVDIGNITYAALAMRDGYFSAKMFGGPTGDDPDFLLLEIVGLDAGSAETGTVPVYLADYRFGDNSLDYILDDWLTVDLTPLGADVQTLEFRFSSSDTGSFGINTPTYFAMDNLVLVPEPGAVLLLFGGLLCVIGRRSRAGLFALLAAGSAQAGSFPADTAVPVDDARIAGWATGVADLTRGPVDIAFPDGAVTTYGEAADAIGVATEDNYDVVSLGDGGSITLTFSVPVFDGPGADLAVFENSFDATFLELAFVEVSSDGVNFVRFPAESETPVTPQVGPYGRLDPTDIHNLAGKYRAGLGTPFDLAELSGTPGLDVNAVTHVRVVDVVGTVGGAGTMDSQGRTINDPYPTNFPTGGFDLDGVAVLGPADTTYAAWAAQYGAGAAGLDDDRDGRSNLLEYALGGNPLAPDTAGALTAGAQQGEFCFTRVPWAADLTYVFEVSSDLIGWTAVAQGSSGNAVAGSAGFSVTEEPVGGGLQKVTVNAPADVYGRLRVSS